MYLQSPNGILARSLFRLVYCLVISRSEATSWNGFAPFAPSIFRDELPDGKLDRNYLKGVLGNKINALLCGAGQNIRIILKKLSKDLFFCLVSELLHLAYQMVQDLCGQNHCTAS